jgi:deazaflavin-dependent oxidoreductase (nitroreductase family)
MAPYAGAMDLRDAFADLMSKSLNLYHRTLLVMSGGRLGRRFGSMKTVELHTTGRKSGQPRATLLTAPIDDGERVVLIASKGGDRRHPDWYRNLEADPDVELTIDGQRRPYRARTASAAEKAELWPAIVEAYRGYELYQRRTDREIPVVICEPR